MGWSSSGASGPLQAEGASVTSPRAQRPLLPSRLIPVPPSPAPQSLPDMLEPAMMPVQPLNITAKTELKLIICPVV